MLLSFLSPLFILFIYFLLDDICLDSHEAPEERDGLCVCVWRGRVCLCGQSKKSKKSKK